MPRQRMGWNVLLASGLGACLAGLTVLGPDDPTAAPARAAPAPARAKKRDRDKYDKVVAEGLQWLALHQAKDGHWGLHDFNKHARTAPLPDGKTFICNCTGLTTRHNDIAATGLALMPFLAAGQTQKPSGKAWPKDYSKTVAAGLDYLISKQGKDGRFTAKMYAHGIASIVLCEAYGLTSDAKLKNPAQRAVNFIVSAQDPKGGGWRYAPREPGDTSVTGWQLTALKRAQLAGLKVPKASIQKVVKYLDSCETEDKGGFGYVPGAGETYSMTAVGLLCRQYLGISPRNPSLLNGVRRLKTHPPGTTNNLYYEYYATQVMHHMAGESWKFWEKGRDGKNGILETISRKQDTGATPRRPHQKGSWDPGTAGVGDGGRIMATSLSLVVLQVRDRVPPYRDEMRAPKEKK